ncbi:MAG: 4'-phosphopantetheinyl transferase superfamily protein [Deltaproteobacteria bacterium]|nr:4'-phosphopantetheinyl transferase superfamily protein [Deltaproteobacteria bacterium]
MPNIGNDVVDLTSPANLQKSTDLRFLRKILTATEIDEVANAGMPDAALWSFWACKEAAYKVFSKQTGDAAFLPRRWSVCLERPLPWEGFAQTQPDGIFPAGWTGKAVVTAEERRVFCRLFITETHVHSLAADETGALERAVARVVPLQNGWGASVAVRESLVTALADFFREDPSLFTVVRPAREDGLPGPPLLCRCGAATGLDISLSHDGQFMAYAFLP